MADLQHKNIPDSELHPPKGASTAQLDTVCHSDGAGGVVWKAVSQGTAIGYADYNDTTTATTPINLTAGTPAYLTNDAAGAFTRDSLQSGLIANTLWTSVDNKFDWAGAGLVSDDMVDIRLDIELTTTTANQEFEVVLEMNTDGVPYDIPFANGIVKTAGSINVNRYNGVYMGDSGTLNGKARFKIVTDSAATVLVRGWYVKVITNR